MTGMFSGSIGKKLLVPTLLFLILILGLLGTVLTINFQKNMTAMMTDKAESVAGFLKKIGTEHILNYDLLGLEDVVAEVQKDPQVVYVTFNDSVGQLIAGTRMAERPDDAIIVDMKLEGEDGEPLGDLHLAYKTDELEDSLAEGFIVTAGSIVVAILVLGLVMNYVIQRNVVGPVGRTVTMLKDIAQGQGDLTRTLPEHGEDEIADLARWFNVFMDNLRDIVGAVQTSAGSVSSSSIELEATAEHVINRSGDLMAQTEQVATAMTQMSQTILDVAKNAGDAASGAGRVSQIAESGKRAVARTVEGMQRISQTVISASETIGELGSSSNEIGNIIRVIDDIADQTNLLALNAAIEAARAGDQGRGFAVVADEVRKLAERTGRATSEITSMIEKIQKDTERSVESMVAGRSEVEEGVKVVQDARDALEQIVGASNDAMSMVQRIAVASEELSTTAETVSENMENILGITQSSSGSMEQVKGASENLARLSSDLIGRIGMFKV